MRSSARGFTIPELVITSFLGMIVTGLLLGVMGTNRNVLGRDIARTNLNQNLRGALDIISADVRVGGENLSANIPAIELVDGGAAGDVLTIRRNLLDEVLPVCTDIAANSAVSSVYYAVAGAVPGCSYSGQTHNFDTWRAYRLDQENDEVRAFIFNFATKQGEFFTYRDEMDNGAQYALVRSAGTWAHSYPVGSSAVYILEEWQYSMNGGNLVLVVDRDAANPFNVSFGLTGFFVDVELQDGTTAQTFAASDDWTDIAAISVTLNGDEMHRGEHLTRSLTGRFFPRNVLSH